MRAALLALLTCLALVLVSALFATEDVQAEPSSRHAALGFCSLSGMTAATSISTCTFTNTLNGAAATWANVSTAADYLVVCAYTAGVVYRDDGVAPTATAGTGGQGISSGSCVSFDGPVASLQFIQQTTGAVLGISFYH